MRLDNVKFFALVFMIGSCSQITQPAETNENEIIMKVNDPHSFAKAIDAVITHLNWDAHVDFEQRIITGAANYHIAVSNGVSELVLDTKDLSIDSVWVDGEKTVFKLDNTDKEPFMGSPLIIPVDASTNEITVYYTTSNNAEALQWLKPTQTAGKKHPFLFTQSQAILARTWIPIQDSPGIRFTYNAKVKVPEGLLALMSAENPMQKSDDGSYFFKMEQPIPAYLMAMAVGDLVYKSIGENTGVYAEPSLIEKAAHEFADLEEMLKTAENLYGGYRWGKYDLIVLPPSFPFGGMENPRLTFVTPTILAGDRSLTSLVAHELAHSWSGNLVTNATWDDFWLNEGFTVYFERRIMEEMHGESYAEMLAVLGYQDLKKTVNDLIEEGKGTDTRLKLQLEGRNPDDGVTDVPYEKGYSFLRMMEEKVGRERFDEFLINYFNVNAFESMTTEMFLVYLDKHLLDKYNIDKKDLQYDRWIFGEGIPDNVLQLTSERFHMVDNALENWAAGISPASLGTREWSSHEWLHFLRGLPERMTLEQMSQLDREFHFTYTGNSEMLVTWLLLSIKNNYEPAFSRLENFLIQTGRRKFLVPLYGELIKTEKGRGVAHQIYQKARENYHFVSTNTLDEMLKH